MRIGTGIGSVKTVSSTPGIPVGVRYSNDFNSSNYTQIGSHTIFTGGSSLRLNGALFGGGTKDYIYYPYYTSSENWSFKITYTVNTTTTANYGPYPALLSVTSDVIDPTKFRINGVFGYCDGETGLGGLPTLFIGNHTTTWTAQGAPGSTKFASGVSVGHSISVTLSRLNMFDYNLYSINNTTGETTTWTYTSSNAYGSTSEMNNLCQLAIGNVGGDNTITAWSFTNNEYKNKNVLIIGDSKAAGLYSDSVDNRFANIIKNTYGKSVAVMGGNSDQVQYECLNTAEHKLILPTKAFLYIGCNDIRSGRTPSQVSGNIGTIKTALESVGTTVYVMTPTPEAGLNLKPLRDQLITDFPSSYIDSWTTLLGSGTSPNAAYVVADNVHPNAAGHAQLATLLSSYL